MPNSSVDDGQQISIAATELSKILKKHASDPLHMRPQSVAQALLDAATEMQKNGYSVTEALLKDWANMARKWENSSQNHSNILPQLRPLSQRQAPALHLISRQYFKRARGKFL